MSSSNNQSSSQPIQGQQAKQSIHGGYPGQLGSIASSGTITVAGYGNATISPGYYTLNSVKSDVIEPVLKARPIGAEVMLFSPVGSDGRFDVSFCQDENGTYVKAKLEPDPTITALDVMRLNMLIIQVMGTAMSGSTRGMDDLKPISYIRSHNLERHFRFSTVK